MLLSTDVNELTLSNVGTTAEFKIRNSAKAFSILSSGLYSNKIRAIIRELSTNALDSHVAAGKREVPFEVHLPTMLEPWFSVQDFGTGLTGDQVTNIYTTYFESTKTDSNDFIGALGLGSKSPFSYTENFTVTAIKDGTKRIYSAFINEMGVPSIAEMSVELTDDINGVEVKFSVTDRYDYESFRHESHNVFTWFENKPTITGVSFTHKSPTYKEKNIVTGVHSLGHNNGSNQNNCIALMGNISYPIKISETSKHFGSLGSLLNCALVFEFNIGEIDFAASREELSYVPLTINSIKKKLEDLNANLAIHLAVKADAITSEWKRAEFLYEESRSQLYSSAVVKYVADTKFSLYDTKSYYGKKTFVHTIEDLNNRGIKIVCTSLSVHGTRNKAGLGNESINGLWQPVVKIPVDSSVVIVKNDLTTGCHTRALYHYSQISRSSQLTIYSITHDSDDLKVREAAYDAFINDLHNPPNVVLASSLSKKLIVKKTPLSSSGIAFYALNNNRPYYVPYSWAPYVGTLSDTELYYYVCLSNHTPMKVDGTSFDMAGLKLKMTNCGISNIADIRVMGVRKNRIKEIAPLPNWIWIEDKITEEIAKLSDEVINKKVAAYTVDNYANRPYNNATVAKLAGKLSDYTKYVKKYGDLPNKTGDISNLAELCKTYGKSIDIDKITNEIQTDQTLIRNKYPLLAHVTSNAPEKDLIAYVKMIDDLPTI